MMIKYLICWKARTYFVDIYIQAIIRFSFLITLIFIIEKQYNINCGN